MSNSQDQYQPSERQVQETVARCISIMVFYQNTKAQRRAGESMTAEVQAVAAEVRRWNLMPCEVARCLLGGVRAELVNRYGEGPGGILTSSFVEAFDGRPVKKRVVTPVAPHPAAKPR